MATVTGRVREYSSPCEGGLFMCHGCSFFLLFYYGSFLFIFFFFLVSFFLFFLFRFIFTLLRTNGNTVIHSHPPGYTRNIIGKKKSAQGRDKRNKIERTIKDSSVIFPRSIFFSSSIFRLLSFLLLLAVACACFLSLRVCVCMSGNSPSRVAPIEPSNHPNFFFSFISPFSKRFKMIPTFRLLYSVVDWGRVALALDCIRTRHSSVYLSLTHTHNSIMKKSGKKREREREEPLKRSRVGKPGEILDGRPSSVLLCPCVCHFGRSSWASLSRLSFFPDINLFRGPPFSLAGRLATDEHPHGCSANISNTFFAPPPNVHVIARPILVYFSSTSHLKEEEEEAKHFLSLCLCVCARVCVS